MTLYFLIIENPASSIQHLVSSNPSILILNPTNPTSPLPKPHFLLCLSNKMIKNSEQLQRFERELIRKEKVNVVRNFQIVESLYNEASELGIFPLKNPLDGLETTIKIAKVVNNVQGTSHKNSKGIK